MATTVDLNNTGTLNLDEGEKQGGSTLNVGGTLTNSGLEALPTEPAGNNRDFKRVDINRHRFSLIIFLDLGSGGQHRDIFQNGLCLV